MSFDATSSATAGFFLHAYPLRDQALEPRFQVSRREDNQPTR
ncbi:hypothetical protein [Demequina sp. NBRC 110053]|nr:hypothetical protein [Demequina sp. NBRC 110053]